MKIRLTPLKPENLSIFKDLLGGVDFGGCFCAVWTSHDENWESRCKDPNQPNFEVTSKDIHNGRHGGFLVYSDKTLVGWTGSGPKTSFPLMASKLGSRLSESSNSIWSIGCLAVPSQHRGKNLSEIIVKAVIDKAKSEGATLIEAYPVRPFHEPRSYRGSYKMFQRLGFTETQSEKDGDYDILLLQLKL